MNWLSKHLRGKSPSRPKATRRPSSIRPAFEMLEPRQMMSANALSNLLNVPVQFALRTDGHLLMTKAGVQTDVASGVQALFQGRDLTGHQVALDLIHGELSEYSPDRGWVGIGATNQVVQDSNGSVWFTEGSTLYLASGVPGAGVALLSNVQSLTTSGGQAQVQIGTYFKANLSAQLSASNGPATLSLSNVQMNVGQFAASFLNKAASTLQAFTKPLQGLADAIEKPLISGWGFTSTWLMQQLGYGQAASDAKAFADTIHTANSLSTTLTATDSWVSLGSFTAKVQGPSQLSTLSSSLSTASSLSSHLGSSLSAALAQLQSIPGLSVALTDPQQLIKLITGETANLFSYTFSIPHAISVTKQQQLAAIPVSPVTLTEFDIYANFALNLSAKATFGYDTSGFQSGNLANGFFMQNASASASLTAGLSGLLNEADLAGYQITGAVTGTATASLKGANSSGKIYANQFATGIAFSAPSFAFGISTKALGPQQMLSLAIQQYGPYLKSLLGNDAQIAAGVLNGKGLTPTQIAQALGSVYGIPPDKAASILKGLNHSADEITNALKGAYNTANQDVARILNGLSFSPATIARALYDSGVHDLSQISTALYNGVTHDLGVISHGLWTMGISGYHLSDVANALYNGVTHDLGAISHGLWNIGVAGFHLSDIAGALYVGVTHDLGAIAHGLWNIGVAGFHLNDIAGALYNGATHDLGAIAKGLWNIGVAGFHYNDIAAALWNMGVSGYHLSDIAAALYNGGLTHDLSQIANALWHMGVGGFHLNDIAGALYKGVTHDLGSIANSLWNMGVGGFHYNDIASALWNMGVGGLHLSDIAAGLYKGLTHDVGSIANALWNMGVAGFHYADISSAVSNMGADATAVANALKSFYAGIGNAGTAVQNVLGDGATAVQNVLVNGVTAVQNVL